MVFYRLLIAFFAGIASSVVSREPSVTLIATGVIMVLIAAEDVTWKQSKKKALKAAETVAALIVGIVSGRWWSFIVFASIPLGAVKGTAAAAFSYAACVLAGRVFTKMPGAEALSGKTPARMVAEVILSIAVLGMCTAVLFLVCSIIERQRSRRIAEKQRISDAVVGGLRERQLSRELALRSFETERNARLLERENISRNIHNNVGHSITAAIMTLEAADMLFDAKPEDARRRMNEAGERIRGSLESIRSAVRALDAEDRPVHVDDLKRYLDNIIEDLTMDTEIGVDRSYEVYSDEVLIPRQHAEFLTGALRECFSNGLRHGGADRFTVLLVADAGHVRMTVKDNGKSDFGADNREERIGGGFGLKKLESYVKRCGGNASFSNEDGFCTTIELSFMS